MPPEPKPAAEQPDVWQSIDQWMDSDRFRAMMRDEFPEDAAEWLDPVSRRQFLSLMGASVALAGAVGCNPSLRPADRRQVIPYVEQPTEVLPGVPLFFATAMPLAGGVATGLLVKSVEGRPNKIEGNPNHPDSLGGTNVYHQASILGLYDPDRSARVLHNNNPSTFDRALQAIRTELDRDASRPAGERGAGVRIVTETTTSPTIIRLMREFTDRYPRARWVQYEPVNRDNARRATEAAFGRPVNPVYRLDRAKVVLALDSDFLSATGPGELRYSRDFMSRRKVRTVEASLRAGEGVRPEDMNRLYAVESMVTSTGAVADHRLPVRPGEVELFARAVAARIGVAGVTAPAELTDLARRWVDPLVEDLNAHRGAAAVLVGEGQPAVVHLLAHAINERLGAFGSTVVFTEPVDTAPADQTADFLALVKDMAAGAVNLLILAGGNPVYDAPADVEFAKALEATRAKGTVVHYGLYEDETASLCNWHINATHYLETWGDVRAFDGTASIQQPLIAPVYGGRSLIELLAAVLGPKSNDPAEVVSSDPLEVVRATWRGRFADKKGTEFDDLWSRFVRDGVVPGTGIQTGADGSVSGGTIQVAAVRLDALNDRAFAGAPLTGGGLQAIFRRDPGVYDGRFANLGWLQELPKPVTKLTWDNAAIMSPRTAADLGCGQSFGWTGGEHGRMITDVVHLTVNGRTVEAGVFILPGHADGCVTLYLGYGRDQRAGRVAVGAGFNAYQLRTTGGMFQTGGVEARRTGREMYLACTQGQYLMEGRRPVRHATVDQFRKDPEFAQIPPASAGEYKEIRALTPGTVEDFDRLGKHHPYHAHDEAESKGEEGKHGHAHQHGDHHDDRLIPLSLYPQQPTQVNGAESNQTYRRWGMAIDLGACTGCSACVVACVSENNIPIVGKDQVTKGRAMHWLRIDRYFSIPGEKVMEDKLGGRDTSQNFLRGNSKRAEMIQQSAAIETHFQPMLCVHCEKAPCEVVCPVAATSHSADGINEMTYNRCVGTRYRSNNCPYKVRRFNFLQYADYTTSALKLVNNPDVTVRTRGVMEKCTYCVQRIRNAEIQAEREFETRPKDRVTGRPKILDGEVVTACQAACPTGAILFGDLNDYDPRTHSGAAVLRWKAEPHNYGVLAEQNTMPRTSYLAEIRNPNPRMPQGA